MGNIDKDKLEKEIKELLDALDTKSMNRVSQDKDMETIEKKFRSRIGLYVASNLKDVNSRIQEINERLSGLGSGLFGLDQSIKDGIESNKNLADKSNKYSISNLFLSGALVFATVCSVGVAIWQGAFIRTYTLETQKLSRVAKEQLGLQLQPTLVVDTDGSTGSLYRFLRLKNIGNGTALNITISSKDIEFVEIPDFLESKVEKDLFLKVLGSEPKRYGKERAYNFKNNEELNIHLGYENINRKKYYTQVIVSKDGVKFVSSGEDRAK